MRVIRIWLGVTWIYAGFDKASDPGFLKAGSSTFIGGQLSAYAQSSPVGFVMNKVLEYSTQMGIFVMFAEFAIGFATLLWIAPTWAAFGGFAMSLSLWLASKCCDIYRFEYDIGRSLCYINDLLSSLC